MSAAAVTLLRASDALPCVAAALVD